MIHSLKTRLSTLVFVFGVFAAGDLAAQHFPSDGELLELIQTRVEEDRATGIVVGVLEADGTRRIVSYGDPGPNAQPLGPESVFEIGSITKVFTGILLADMVARGEVTLEAPIQAYVPAGVTIPNRAGREITLLDLSTHRSALPRLPGNLEMADYQNPYATYTDDLLYEFLSGHELSRDIGSQYEYSNLATGLLGHLLALRADTDYEALVRERILEPLGMTMTGIALSDDMAEWLAIGHTAEGQPTKNWDLPTLEGAGALRSNMNDMLTFLEANVGAANTDLERAMRDSHQVRQQAAPGMDVGLNWHIRHVGDQSIVWHNGGTGGYRTFAGFDPDTGVGAVVLTNSGHGADDIGFHLINPTLDLAGPPEPAVERTAIDVDSSVLERYIGAYEIVPQFVIDITLEDDALFLQATGQPKFPIYAESETKFFLEVVDAQISFVIEGGEVTSLILHQGGVDQTARKIR